MRASVCVCVCFAVTRGAKSANFFLCEPSDGWADLLARFSHSGLSLHHLVFSVTFASPDQVAQHEDIKNFFDAHAHKGEEWAVASALEVVRTNAAWIAENSAAVEKHLQAHTHAPLLFISGVSSVVAYFYLLLRVIFV